MTVDHAAGVAVRHLEMVAAGRHLPERERSFVDAKLAKAFNDPDADAGCEPPGISPKRSNRNSPGDRDPSVIAEYDQHGRIRACDRLQAMDGAVRRLA